MQVKGILGEGAHRGRKAIVDEFLAPVRGHVQARRSQGDGNGDGLEWAARDRRIDEPWQFVDGRPYENLYVFALEFKDGKVHRPAGIHGQLLHRKAPGVGS